MLYERILEIALRVKLKKKTYIISIRRPTTQISTPFASYIRIILIKVSQECHEGYNDSCEL